MIAKKTLGWVMVFTAAIGLGACGDSGGGGSVDAATEEALSSDDPVVAMNAWRKGLAENKPEVLWNAMPERYRGDVTGLVHDFAAKVDPGMFTEATGLLKRAATVLDAKKELILQNPMIKQMAARQGAGGDNVEAAIGGVIKMLNTVAGSDAMELDKLKELDVGAFVQETGGSLMSQVSAMMKLSPKNEWDKIVNTSFEAVSVDGDTATIKATSPGKSPTTEKLKRVDGRWVPADMADEWDEAMAEARDGLGQLDASKMTPDQRKKWDEGIKMVDGMISSLEGVETASDFNQLMGKVMMQLMGGLGGMGGR